MMNNRNSLYLCNGEIPIYICDVNIAEEDIENAIEALYCDILFNRLSILSSK